MTERHLAATLGAQHGCIAAGSGLAGRVERDDLTSAVVVAGVDEGEQVAAHPAQMWRRDGDRRVGRDRGVDRIPALGEHGHTGLRRKLIS